jgi:hypothetical protein
MDTLIRVLYCLAAIPTIGGILILTLLAPRPSRLTEHLQGISRYLMLGGAAFSTARVLDGNQPHWEDTMIIVGIAIAVTIYARENHLLAKAQERLEDGQESGV